MQHIHVVAACPKLMESPLSDSIIKRARERQLVDIQIHDLRAYATDKHHQLDDYDFGGGPGMILKPEPIFRCLEDIYERFALGSTPVTLLTPAGEAYTQKKAIQLSLREHIVLLCGHYKGIDERVIETFVREEISIGDYIVTGGEIAAIAIIDSVVRLLPGAISDIDSAEGDSIQSGLLDFPHYTRPRDFSGQVVPDVLLSGDHKKIGEWRLQQALDRTQKRRPDLHKKYLENN
jgi:tRNA (guanine37-N1)-methyltransferase